MLFIAITKLKEKFGLTIRLVLFLVLIGLVIPQFLNFVASEIVKYKIRPYGESPPALRVEKSGPDVRKEHILDKDFIKKLRDFYRER